MMQWRRRRPLRASAAPAGRQFEARVRSRGAVALLLFGTILSSAALAGENVLFNPEFDIPLMEAGWTIYFGSLLDWTPEDSNACAGTGSGRIAS